MTSPGVQKEEDGHGSGACMSASDFGGQSAASTPHLSEGHTVGHPHVDTSFHTLEAMPALSTTQSHVFEQVDFLNSKL